MGTVVTRDCTQRRSACSGCDLECGAQHRGYDHDWFPPWVCDTATEVTDCCQLPLGGEGPSPWIELVMRTIDGCATSLPAATGLMQSATFGRHLLRRCSRRTLHAVGCLRISSTPTSGSLRASTAVNELRCRTSPSRTATHLRRQSNGHPIASRGGCVQRVLLGLESANSHSCAARHRLRAPVMREMYCYIARPVADSVLDLQLGDAKAVGARYRSFQHLRRGCRPTRCGLWRVHGQF